MAGVVAGVVAMVPEGLVLLTSLAFAIAAVALARRNVLVQELPAVEGLARVDVVCLDKTGTLTEGIIEYDAIQILDADLPVNDALAALADDPNRNATATALAVGFPADRSGGQGWERTETVPFSSARKWSGATFGARGTWVLGAPEMVWAGKPATDPVRVRGDELAAAGPASPAPRAHRRRVRRRGSAGRPARGRTRPVQGEDPARRRRHARVLPPAGCRAQGDLRRQSAHGVGRRRAPSASRVRRTPSMPVSSRKPTTRSPTCSTARRCTGGCRPTRSAPSSVRSRAAGTSWR